MWKRFFTSGWCVAASAVLAALLASPSLLVGLIADDFFHWQIFAKHFDNTHTGSPFGMFSFADGNTERTHELMQKGVFPWWTIDSLRLSFWRPLAELTHWFDYQWWPESPMLMHAQNIIWYSALVIALGVWLRSIDSNKYRAGVATLIYATSSTHGTVVGWIANRNALIAAFFAVVCLMFFHFSRQSATSPIRRYGLFLCSLLAFGLSLLSGESAIATTPYLFAYALLLDKNGHLLSRMASLFPYVLMALVWKFAYSQFGYGSYGSGAYIDPAAEAEKFLPVALMRMPALLFAQFFGVPSVLYNFMPTPVARIAYTLIALFVLILFFLALRSVNLHREKIVQFFALATMLAVIPACATVPDDRLLTFVGFGGAGLLSAFICEVTGSFWKRRSVAIKILAGWLVLLHFIIMPALFPRNATIMASTMEPYLQRPAISFPEQNLTPNTRVILINPPLPSCVSYLPSVRQYYGLTPVKYAMALASGSRRMVLEVVDDKTLRIDVPTGFISPLDSFFRDPEYAFSENQKIDLGEVNVVVEKVAGDGQAVRARFEFANLLNSSDLQFYVWNKGGYHQISLPPAGKKIEINAFDFRHPNNETVGGI